MSRRKARAVAAGWSCSAWLCLSLAQVGAVQADPPGRQGTQLRAAAQGSVRSTLQPVQPQTASVSFETRLRVLAALASRHARKGENQRALDLFYRILHGSDPSWPQGPQGDSLRIARDIKVAKMMAQSGFREHALRVLQAALILAQVNNDPQSTQVRDMIRTIESSLGFKQGSEQELRRGTAGAQRPADQWKEIPLPGTIFGDETSSSQPVRPASSGDAWTAFNGTDWMDVSGTEDSGQNQTAQVAPAGTDPSLSQGAAVSAAQIAEPDARIGLAQSAAGARPAGSVDQNLRILRPRRRISPDVSPTHCPQCAAMAARNRSGQPATAGAWPACSKADPTTATARTSFAPTTWNRFASRQVQAPAPSIGDETQGSPSTVAESHGRNPVRPGAVLDDSGSSQQKILGNGGAGGESRAEHNQPQRRATAAPPSFARTTASRPANSAGQLKEPIPTEKAAPRQLAAPRMPASGLAAQNHPSSRDSTRTIPAQQDQQPVERPSLSATYLTRVGIVGHVASPGLYETELPGTTVTEVVRQAGGIGSGYRQAVVIRPVNLSTASNTFYFLEIDLSDSSTAGALAPLQPQDLLLIGSESISGFYVAVMPHFILRLPIQPSSAMSADDVVEQLRQYWPQLSKRRVGLLRLSTAGTATPGQQIVQTPLQDGDVLYVNGLRLDPSQVLAAAQAVATRAGVGVRTVESTAPGR